jgi:hypothetical protein
MKTSHVLSAAFKVVGIVFFMETLNSVPSAITAISLYLNGLSKVSPESISDFSSTIIVVAGFVLLSLVLTALLIIYSDSIARYLVQANDREVGINPHWNIPDILYISIQIIAILIVVDGSGYFFKSMAKGICLLFHPDIFKPVLDPRMRIEIGSEITAGLFNLIFGVALFFLSHRITDFLDRFYLKGARPVKGLDSGG